MRIITEGQASFLEDAAQGGLIAEFANKREASNDAKRKVLVAELKQVCIERAKTMPAFIAAQRAAETRVQETQSAYASALLASDAATLDRMGTEHSFDEREYTKRKRLAELAPKILDRTDRKLERLADLLKDGLYFRAIALPAPGGYGVVAHHSSNLATIEPLLANIKAKRALLAEMVYLDIDHLTVRENCAAVLKDVKEKVAATAIIVASVLAEILSDEAAALPAPPLGARGAASLAGASARASA